MGDHEIPVRTLRTTFAVIELLDERDGAGVTEVAEALGTSKSAAHSHLDSLARLGYVTRRGTDYVLGAGFLGLGLRVRTRIDVYAAARPHVAALAETTGDDAALFVEDGDEAICLYAAGDGRGDWEGGRIPLHSTAAGKAMLAHRSRDDVRAFVDRNELAPRTAHTITDERALLDELRTVRERGTAFEREEHRADRRAVAVAVRDADDDVAGSIAVSGSADDLSGKRLEEDVAGLVVSRARTIEVQLARGSDASGVH